MKKTYLLLPTLGMLLLASCSKPKECPDGNLFTTPDQVRFSATISDATSARVMNNAWDAADAIGVYALQEGKTLTEANLYDGKSNVKYTTPGDGVFTAAGDGISFPKDGKLDFIAYYPYMESLNGYSYPIDVTNQTNAATIDILYSNNVKGAVKDKANIGLAFDHALSALVLQVSAGDGIPALTGLTAQVEGLKVKGALNLVNGIVSATGDAVALVPAVTVNDKTATIRAIVVPGQDLTNAKVVLTLNGKVYEWKPKTEMLEGTKKYTYMIQLSTSGIVLVNPNATINDWKEGHNETTNIVLKPKGGVEFSVSKAAVSFDAKENLSQQINLTADAEQAWTAASDADWLSIDPTNGTGPQDITLTATKNTEKSQRIAHVTFTPNGHAPVVVTVTQAAAADEAVTPTPAPNKGTLLAPGTDFEDWNAFNNSLTEFKGNKNIKPYIIQANGQGRNGSAALHIKTTPLKKNDYAFTIGVPTDASFAGKTKIVMWIKGTSERSISFNLFPADGQKTYFNLGDCSEDKILNPESKNQYGGIIDTKGEWRKVTLNISSLSLNAQAGGDLLACKVGNKAAWDVYIDDITIE